MSKSPIQIGSQVTPIGVQLVNAVPGLLSESVTQVIIRNGMRFEVVAIRDGFATLTPSGGGEDVTCQLADLEIW